MQIPSKLDGATILKEIGEISGTDLTGQAANVSTLGLANWYGVGLLTSCGHYGNGSVVCEPNPPKIGYYFNPPKDLKLDSTALQGAYTKDLRDSISSYSDLSKFLAGGVMGGGILVLVSNILTLCALQLGAAISAIATIVLLAASIAAVVIFSKLNTAFNDNFNSVGMTSKLGNYGVALSFVATFFSLLATALLITQSRRDRRTRRGGAGRRPISFARSVGSLDHGRRKEPTLPFHDNSHGDSGNKPGLLERMPLVGGGQHGYVQVEKQPVLVRTDVTGQQRALSVSPNLRAQDEEDVASQKVPLMALGGANKPGKDLNTAYEPYRRV